MVTDIQGNKQFKKIILVIETKYAGVGMILKDPEIATKRTYESNGGVGEM